MIQGKTLPVEHTQPAEFVVELGKADTVSTNLANRPLAPGADPILGMTSTGTRDADQLDSDPYESKPASVARGSFTGASALGLGGVAIILLGHYCSPDHDFIAALVGVAFCLSGWLLASRSFPHATREYSTSSQNEEEAP